MSSTSEIDYDGYDFKYLAYILGEICKNEDLRDVKLIAEFDGQMFPVHRLVMVSSSKYFAALLGPNFKEGKQDEVTISSVDGPTLKAIIDFCYSGDIQITDENAETISETASAMEMVHIEKLCEQFWSENLTESNCVKIFVLADTYTFTGLRKESFDYICENFEELETGKLQKLKFNHFSELLKSDSIYAREEFIFQCLVDWVDYHETPRSKYVPELLKSIRLEKISQPFLADTVDKFAEKHKCRDVVINEYQRRANSDDKSNELYRYTENDSICLYSLTCEADLVNVEKYNPVSNRWELCRNITVTGLITERVMFGMIFNENNIFLMGGFENEEYVAKVDAYLLDKMEFLTRANTETARARIAPILYGGEVFIFGGWNENPLKTCECLSLETMTTTTLKPMQYERFNYACVVMYEKIYVAGGQSADDSYLCSVECYDPEADEWTKIANMNHARASFGLAERNGMLYAFGHHETIEQYDPNRDVWSKIEPFDGSETVMQAVNFLGDIYVLMKDGSFGKIKIEPELTFLSLRKSNLADSKKSNCIRSLFIN